MKLKAHSRLPSLTALRTFEVAARSESFSAAAKELFVTPGAVSRQIRLLEEEIGVTLFERYGNAVEINPDGQQLATELTDAFNHVLKAVEDVQIQLAVEIRISSAPSIAGKLLTNWLNEYADQHDEISISLDATDRIVNLERNEADLAIRFIPSDTLPETSRLLMQEILLPVCSPSYYAEHGPWAIPENLPDSGLLHAEWDAGGHAAIPGWVDWFSRFATKQKILPSRVKLQLLGLAVHEAQNHRGIALGPKTLVNEDLKRGDLIAPFGEKYQLPISWVYCIVWPENRPLGPAQSDLVDWICTCAAKSFGN